MPAVHSVEFLQPFVIRVNTPRASYLSRTEHTS